MSHVQRKTVPQGATLTEIFVQDGIEYSREEWSQKLLLERLDRIIELLAQLVNQQTSSKT